MIITCKFCGGTGRSPNLQLFEALSNTIPICPACRGAGELMLLGSPQNCVICKICGGKGSAASSLLIMGSQTICPACKGAGIVARPVIQSGVSNDTEISPGPLPRPRSLEYDIALSYASEDKEIVEKYAQKLKENGLKVFIDSDEKAKLWGADLYVELDEIYRMKARFCIMFISKHYASKRWTNLERQSAQARAFKENKEYILPVKLDDTQIPGLRETIGYIDLRKVSLEELIKQTIEKSKIN